MTLPLHIIPTPDTDRTIVCEIRRIANEVHMQRCRVAIRNRDPHPFLSWNGFRVTERKRLKAVVS
jgi:hypothetical protein